MPEKSSRSTWAQKIKKRNVQIITPR